MGAAHSSEPRSVSMENPTPSSVIDVSDEVVERLKKGITKQARDNAAATPPPPPPPKQEQPPPRTVPLKPAAPPAAAPVAPARAPTVTYPPPPAAAYPSAAATTTAIDVRRQKELELQQNDALWRQRMAQLEATLNKTNAVMEKEYSAAVEDVRKRFATAAPSHQLPPCQDLKAQLIACYRAYPGETLKCAEEVALFRNCVSAHRIKKLDAEEAQPAKAKAKGA